EHRLYHADQTEIERTLAAPRGLTHGGADQRDESGDQRLESLLPYGGGVEGLHRPRQLHVLSRAVLHETPPPTEIRLVENHEVLGAHHWSPAGPLGLCGQSASCHPPEIRLDEDCTASARPHNLFPRLSNPTGVLAPATG